MVPDKTNISQNNLATIVLDAVRHPIILLDENNKIAYANADAEQFFRASSAILSRNKLETFLPFGSPLLSLINQVREKPKPVNEYHVDLSSPKLGYEKLVDIFVQPIADIPGGIVVLFQEKSMAEKLDRQMVHRGSARSVTGLASMLAHEIKNPLSGIRGAAQLLEGVVSDEDRQLTHLITEETDRIVALVDRMEVFSDERPIERFPVNIHTVLDHVKVLAKSGFARDIHFIEKYDPSLPPVFANRDQLIQIFLNLVKNATEALSGRDNATITLTSSYRPGIRLSVPGRYDKVTLPMEFTVEDNGPGVPADIQENLFDPFITTKQNGKGLGLALVAKLVNDHGGVVECESEPGKTVFRVLLPMWQPEDANNKQRGE